MKKILPVILAIIVIVAVGLIYVFTRHTHAFAEATCETASTCECGEIQGEALGHTWIDATCTDAKTCSTCGKVDGEPLEHNWIDATEDAPKTCELCGLTEGEPLAKLGTVEGYEAPVEDETNTGGVDSTGHDAVFEEGDYIEPTDEKPIDLGESTGVKTTDETVDFFRQLYEEGVISEEEFNKMVAIGEQKKEEAQQTQSSTPGHIDVDVPGVSEDTGDNSGLIWDDPDLPDELKGSHVN